MNKKKFLKNNKSINMYQEYTKNSTEIKKIK